MKKIITIIAATMVSATAFSQVEPVDKNKKGVYAGGSLRFGQSFQAGTGSSGATFGAAARFTVSVCTAAVFFTTGLTNVDIFVDPLSRVF